MSTTTETRAEAWKRRASLTGSVDFTMMYVAHDAFNRDLARLLRASEAGDGLSAAAIATWRSFSKQLHTHHNAEDAALWPRLYSAVSDEDEIRILKDMEAEHGSLDPRLEQIDAAIEARDDAVLGSELKALAQGLAQHMIHEEEAALPLLERRTGKAGWDSFTKEIRGQQGGLKGAAEYLPWVLDGATPRPRPKSSASCHHRPGSSTAASGRRRTAAPDDWPRHRWKRRPRTTNSGSPTSSRLTDPTCVPWPIGCSGRSPKPTTRSRKPGSGRPALTAPRSTTSTGG